MKRLIVKLRSGLGNQIFQFATGYALSKHLNLPLYLELSFYHVGLFKYTWFRDFYFSTPVFDSLKIRLGRYPSRRYLLDKYKISCPTLDFKPSENTMVVTEDYWDQLLDLDYSGGDDIFLIGWWQSERYFKHLRDDLLDVLSLRSPMAGDAGEVEKQIRSSASISLHIRRSDYLLSPDFNIYGAQYYNNALSQMHDAVGDAKVFVFSDDIKWAKENITSGYDLVYVSENNTIPDYEQLYLMSLCDHNIICNSSFSWWGAWLNQNPDKYVFYPDVWCKIPSLHPIEKVIPESWTQRRV